MDKKQKRAAKTCADCIHESACRMWTDGRYISDASASQCPNHETVKESASYLCGVLDERKRKKTNDDRYWKTVEQRANAARKRWEKPNETNDTDDVYAVEVVRCRECKHLMFSDCYGECGKGHMGVVRPDDFCSRGERKEGAE